MSGTLFLSFYTLSVLISPHTPSNSVLVLLSPYTASTTFWSFYSPHTASTTSWFFYHPTLFRQRFGPYITPHCRYTLSALLSSNTASNLFQSFYHPTLLLHPFGPWSLYHPTLLHPFSPSITPPASTTFWPFAVFRPIVTCCSKPTFDSFFFGLSIILPSSALLPTTFSFFDNLSVCLQLIHLWQSCCRCGAVLSVYLPADIASRLIKCPPFYDRLHARYPNPTAFCQPTIRFPHDSPVYASLWLMDLLLITVIASLPLTPLCHRWAFRQDDKFPDCTADTRLGCGTVREIYEKTGNTNEKYTVRTKTNRRGLID